MPSTFFHRTMDRTTDSGYAKKWIFSAWIKISQLGATANKGVFSIQKGSTSNSRVNVGFNSSDNLWVETKDSTGNTDAFKETQMRFRDVNAWYHIYIKYDSTESTAADRLVMFVNGVEQTYNNVDEVGSNFGILMDGNVDWRLGIYRTNGGAIRYFDGVMSHVHFSEFNDSDTPTAYTAFGETDSTTGEWKIKASPTVSYGSQGLFVLKDNNLGTDQSGQSNNLTASGTCTKTEDCPSNVFATWNLLATNTTLSTGNTESELGSPGTGYHTGSSTLAMTSGKFYMECKVNVQDDYPGLGICRPSSPHTRRGNNWLGDDANSYGFYVGTGSNFYHNNSNVGSIGTTLATNDVLGMALDLDSTQNTLKLYKNGSLISTQNIIDSDDGWMFAYTHVNGKANAVCKANFGNGYFKTTAISSAGTNASNLGIFEYDVPSGYTALCTKGLNE